MTLFRTFRKINDSKTTGHFIENDSEHLVGDGRILLVVVSDDDLIVDLVSFPQHRLSPSGRCFDVVSANIGDGRG